MHFFAHVALMVALLIAIIGAFVALIQLWTGRYGLLLLVERCQLAILGLSTIASCILYCALVTRDFTYRYVVEYTDLTMPFFYTITAFWAGQAGSLLFWLWTVVLFGTVFWATASYRSLSSSTRLCFWIFYLGVTAFLLLLLTVYSSPFQQCLSPPSDGNGLNPLLQNPGMIFHPPLLLLGYAGFTVPACLALAQLFTCRGRLGTVVISTQPGYEGGEDLHWATLSRNFTLLAWLLFTAGIVLGGWWAYMELGWGGYWAWDPVENASLIPWLIATAALHTSVLETRRGGLPRTNALLMALTLISSFFATYLVRSGVVDSLHSFGGGTLSGVLLVGILGSFTLSMWIVCICPPPPGRSLAALVSRDGLLFLAVCLLLALSLVIMLATLWPVISRCCGLNPMGLSAGFYNQVCLPLFVLLAGMLAFCPWLSWKGGVVDRHGVLFMVSTFFCVVVTLWFIGIYKVLAVFGVAVAVACLVGIVVLLITNLGVRRARRTWAAYGAHAGLVLIIIGVAFSGPYQRSVEARLRPGQHLEIAGYRVTYADLCDGGTAAMAFIETKLCVTKNGREVGLLTPQRRFYRNFSEPLAEVSVLPSLGNELYATLLDVDKDRVATVKVNVNPLVNWIWIGGTLMTLFPLCGMTRSKGLVSESAL